MLPILSDQTLWEKLSEWYENSFLNEFLTYLTEKYFSLEFGSYENFSISNEATATIRLLVIGLMFGMMIASIMTVRTRQGLGLMVRKLLNEEAFDPSKAKTLSDLGLFRSTLIRRELSRGVSLRKVVKCVEEEEWNALHAETETKKSKGKTKPEKFKMDFTVARFYIPEDLKFRAEIRYEQKGSGWKMLLLTTVLSLLIGGLIFWLLPDIIGLVDGIVTVIGG